MKEVMTALCLGAAAVSAGCRGANPMPDMNPLAERYVKLVLKVGQHDENFVDAYYGDPAWKPTGTPDSLVTLAAEATTLRREVQTVALDARADNLVRLRREYLDKQLGAVETRIAMLGGQKLSFDEEAARLYDAQPPARHETDFLPVLEKLDQLLPGRGSLADRYAAFRDRFVIPKDKVDAVFRAAIDGCRAKTLERLQLPRGESFTVEYVTGKPWSAYNWYKGNFTSVIQVNTDLPITIDRAIDLACHEGYPGHHVYNALLEENLVRNRGWVEFSVYPLFSPQSLIAEGTANFGIEVAFPGEARTAFERERLYPLAGLDPVTAEKFADVQREVAKLTYAGNEAARKYLNGRISRAEAIEFLQRWAVSPKDRAEQRTRFFDQYRSYVINYNYGQDLVREYVEKRGGTADKPDVRWKAFGELMSSPRLPSGLK
jgi:hypothetical protein